MRLWMHLAQKSLSYELHPRPRDTRLGLKPLYSA